MMSDLHYAMEAASQWVASQIPVEYSGPDASFVAYMYQYKAQRIRDALAVLKHKFRHLDAEDQAILLRNYRTAARAIYGSRRF